MSAQQRPTVWVILSDTWRIISAQPRHFSALSILFILPLSLSAVIYPFLFQPINNNNNNNGNSSQFILKIIYSLCSLILSLCGGASITYATFHGFYGKPEKLISSLKSILVSFLPLFATNLISGVILGLIIFCFGIIVLLAYSGLFLFGVQIDYADRYFIFFVILIAILLVAATIYVQVGWILTTAVVVVESLWGYAPLKRSWYLVKGMRWTVFWMVLLFGAPSGILSTWYSNMVINGRNGGDGLTILNWGFVVEMIVCVCIWTVVSLYSTAAATVLFIYCKELQMTAFVNGDEEFGRVYAPLPYNDAA